MKKLFLNGMFLLMAVMASVGFVSCDSDSDSANRDHDASLYGEWVESNGNRYVFGYYHFYSDGTGISGSYEPDIDWVNEEDEFEWYTVDDEYLYINGTQHEYWCDGSSLEITRNGRTKYYYEK